MELAVQHYNLFPTRIWQVKLHELSSHFPAWVSAVNALRAATPTPAGRSNRQGWNSADKAILHQPGFAALHGAVRASCLEAFKQMGMAHPAFTVESWINIHDRGGFNFQHMHEGAMLSGSFYLQVPEGAGNLVFRDPRPGVVSSFLKGSDPNAYNDVHLHPETGLLVMFPYWLEHHVEPHNNDIPRISISFNALRS
jgi:uncharacterized protein (TIGR02466 family)